MDDLSVIKSECYNCNLHRYLITFRSIDAKARKLCQPLFHFILDVGSELTDLRYRVRRVQILIDELLVHIWLNLELTRIIRSRYRINVPINKLVILNTPHVLNHEEHEQGDKNTNATDSKAQDLPLLNLIRGYNASHLHIDIWICVTFFRGLHIQIIEIRIEGQLAFTPILTFLIQLLFDGCVGASSYPGWAILITLFTNLLVNCSLVAPCVRWECIWNCSDLCFVSAYENGTSRTFNVHNISLNSARFTHHSGCAPVSDKESTNWIRRLDLIVLATSINNKQWNGEKEYAKEHLGQALEDLIICIDTIPQNDIRITYVLFWEL